MSDLIDRKTAIDVVRRLMEDSELSRTVQTGLYILPSAQPEPLTDKEQRIFLAAMGREEQICKKVDEEYQESYEDSLIKICHEIRRKIKGELWI